MARPRAEDRTDDDQAETQHQHDDEQANAETRDDRGAESNETDDRSADYDGDGDDGRSDRDHRRARSDRDGRHSTDHHRAQRPRRPLSEIINAAREELENLIGRPVEAVSGVDRTEDGFVVTVDVLELERIPVTTSVLASYEVELDSSGAVLGFNRVRRYYRNQGGDL